MATPGARYPPGPVLEQLTAPTPGVSHFLDRALALIEQLSDEVLDLALESLRLLYPQGHIPPAGTSNHLVRLGLQRRVEAAQAGGVVEQYLALHNSSTAQGHQYLHQLLFLPRAATEHRRQNLYHTHPERLGAQGFPQPAPPALPPGQGQEALLQWSPLDTTSTLQQRGSSNADGAELDLTNCGVVAWTAACRHLAPDTMGLRQYWPTDGTALVSTVAAVTMEPLAAWPVRLLPYVPCRDTQPRQPAAMHTPTAPLTAEQLYVVAAGYWRTADRVLSTTTARRRSRAAYKARSARRPTHGTPRSVSAPASGTRVMAQPPPEPQQGQALELQAAGYPAILHDHTGGYRSHILGGGRCTVWHGTARQGAFPPHVNWQQEPTQAYYVTADPWPLAVLLHTISAPNKWQEPGRANPPALVWSPDQEEHLQAAWQGDAIRTADVPDLHAGPITHARLAATLAVARRGQQNPHWVVCMFSPADAHIAVGDPQRLPGSQTVICVANCARVIVKALREGEHHALLLRVCLKDNARAPEPGVWPAAARPADLELQLADRTTVYHWLQAFDDLRRRGKPDRQIGTTHWQEWLQPDVQPDAAQGLGPAPATRVLDASVPGRALAPHADRWPTYSSTRHQGAPSASGCRSLRQGGPRNPHNAPYVRTSTTQAERCWNTWRGTRCTLPPQRKTRRRPPTSSRGGHGDPCCTPCTPSAPLQAPGHAASPGEEEEACDAAQGAGGAGHQGSIPAGLAPLLAPLMAGSPHPMAPAQPGDLTAPADPAART